MVSRKRRSCGTGAVQGAAEAIAKRAPSGMLQGPQGTGASAAGDERVLLSLGRLQSEDVASVGSLHGLVSAQGVLALFRFYAKVPLRDVLIYNAGLGGTTEEEGPAHPSRPPFGHPSSHVTEEGGRLQLIGHITLFDSKRTVALKGIPMFWCEGDFEVVGCCFSDRAGTTVHLGHETLRKGATGYVQTSSIGHWFDRRLGTSEWDCSTWAPTSMVPARCDIVFGPDQGDSCHAISLCFINVGSNAHPLCGQAPLHRAKLSTATDGAGKTRLTIGKDQVAEVSMDMRWLDEGWVSEPTSSSADASYARDAAHPGGSSQADQAIYCDYCAMWLNGPTQWADHQKGQKHKKNATK